MKNSAIDRLEQKQLRRVPSFTAGDRLRVHFQVIEGTRQRTQVFEGIVLKRQGHGARETFTVRKQSFGVGVERTFPLHSPKIEKIEIASRGSVRRAKLYYLRDRVGKAARVQEKRYSGPEEAIEPGLLHVEEAEPETPEGETEATQTEEHSQTSEPEAVAEAPAEEVPSAVEESVAEEEKSSPSQEEAKAPQEES